MALDWGKQISFSGLRRGKSGGGHGKAAYPAKTYMNLVAPERKPGETRRNVLAGIAVVLLAALVIKFGILDFYGRVDAKRAELSAQQQVLSAAQASLSEYDDVLSEYEGYESANIMESGLVVDALDALSLVDRCVAPHARVATLTLSGDTLSLKLAGTTLDQLGVLVADLEAQDIVSSALLSTAATQQTEGADVTATVTVTLQPAAAPGEGD